MRSWVAVSLEMCESQRKRQRERECWRRPNSFGVNAYLSTYGNQHLNDNECLRAAKKELSCSACSPFEALWVPSCLFTEGKGVGEVGLIWANRAMFLYKSSGQGPGAAHLWKKLSLFVEAEGTWSL